jgi:hypothetical protein
MTIEVPRSFTIRSSFGKLKATVWGPFTSWCQIKTHQPWFSLLWNRNSYIRGGEKYFSKSFTKKLIFKGWTNRVLDPGIVNGMGSCQKKRYNRETTKDRDLSYIYSKNIPLHYKEAGWPEWEQHWHFLICMHCPLEDFVPKTKQIYSVRNHEYKKRSSKKNKYQLCI